MTSYEFEIIAKNAVIDKVKAEYGEDLKIEEVHQVWFSKTLQNFKICLCDSKPTNSRFYECTYNGNKKEMYVDIYEKKYNFKVDYQNFQKAVKR